MGMTMHMLPVVDRQYPNVWVNQLHSYLLLQGAEIIVYLDGIFVRYVVNRQRTTYYDCEATYDDTVIDISV